METSVKTSVVTETGHSKNISNFKSIIVAAISFGDAYNVPKVELSVAGMQNLHERCENALIAVSSANAAYKNAVDARNSIFDPLNKLVTRLVNALKASSSSDRIEKNARELARKIQGTRANAKRTEEEKKADDEAGIDYNEISSSQMSFESRYANFRNLVEFLSSVTEYKPNEKEFQVESLKAYAADLKSKNEAVTASMMALNNTRALRNELMYKPGIGMVDVASDVKSYIKSIFGPTSLQFKKVSALEFTKYKN
jgi:DNA repair exonuclease SbcCD ATPase subunit